MMQTLFTFPTTYFYNTNRTSTTFATMDQVLLLKISKTTTTFTTPIGQAILSFTTPIEQVIFTLTIPIQKKHYLL